MKPEEYIIASKKNYFAFLLIFCNTIFAILLLGLKLYTSGGSISHFFIDYISVFIFFTLGIFALYQKNWARILIIILFFISIPITVIQSFSAAGLRFSFIFQCITTCLFTFIYFNKNVIYIFKNKNSEVQDNNNNNNNETEANFKASKLVVINPENTDKICENMQDLLQLVAIESKVEIIGSNPYLIKVTFNNQSYSFFPSQLSLEAIIDILNSMVYTANKHTENIFHNIGVENVSLVVVIDPATEFKEGQFSKNYLHPASVLFSKPSDYIFISLAMFFFTLGVTDYFVISKTIAYSYWSGILSGALTMAGLFLLLNTFKQVKLRKL